MQIQVAFYKAKNNWVHKLIRWWTKSIYSHAELILPDGKTWISISPFLTAKLCSKQPTDFNTQDWDFITIDVTKTQAQIIEDFFHETKGSHYDWVGLFLSHILPYKIKKTNKWYCSEWIAYALRIANVIDWKTIKIYEQSDLSPQRLYEIITYKKDNV